MRQQQGCMEREKGNSKPEKELKKMSKEKPKGK